MKKSPERMTNLGHNLRYASVGALAALTLGGYPMSTEAADSLQLEAPADRPADSLPEETNGTSIETAVSFGQIVVPSDISYPVMGTGEADSYTPSPEETVESRPSVPLESLYSGNKIGVITATNAQGETIIDVPLFVSTHPDYAETSNLLSRGAMHEVASPLINPDTIGDTYGRGELGLLGVPNGQTLAVINGHNITRINPDTDGDPSNGNEGASQQVFERLDEMQPGDDLTITFDPEDGGGQLEYEMVGSRTVYDVETPSGGLSLSKSYDIFSRPPEYAGYREVVILYRCGPDGSTEDRFIVYFASVDQ